MRRGEFITGLRGALVASPPKRRGEAYVDKILRGAQPDSLPVEQMSNYELIVNSKTAKILRLTVPPSLFVRADEVIE
jgi:putative ABC transport system substrate-binding protein